MERPNARGEKKDNHPLVNFSPVRLQEEDDEISPRKGVSPRIKYTLCAVCIIAMIAFSSFMVETREVESSTHAIIEKQIPSSPSDILDSKISGVSGKLFLGEKIRTFEKALFFSSMSTTELIKKIGEYVFKFFF